MTYFEYQKAVFASTLTTSARLVALAIASHYNWTKKEPAFAGVDLLSKETGLSARAVIRARKELVEDGFLEMGRRFNSTSLCTPTVQDTQSSRLGHTVLSVQDANDTLIEKLIDKTNREELETVAIAPVSQDDVSPLPRSPLTTTDESPSFEQEPKADGLASIEKVDARGPVSREERIAREQAIAADVAFKAWKKNNPNIEDMWKNIDEETVPVLLSL